MSAASQAQALASGQGDTELSVQEALNRLNAEHRFSGSTLYFYKRS